MMSTAIHGIILITASLALTIGSSWIEQLGPDHGVYCAIGKVRGIEVYCPELKRNGGWPAPYLFDNPGISVERQLGFFEDDFRAGPFAADVAFYMLVLLALSRVARAMLRRS